ncbi:MAG: hypothetical protein VYD19_09195 [Myxococcota bacterium]|nr:hypothetical protein [Myxococcota bacterium]
MTDLAHLQVGLKSAISPTDEGCVHAELYHASLESALSVSGLDPSALSASQIARLLSSLGLPLLTE